MKSLCIAFCSLLLAIAAGGCLSVEQKEYHFHLNADGDSGTGSIAFVNIFSSDNDSETVARDFSELITDYLQGDKVDSLYPGVANLQRRLFTRDGKLCGEVTFTFSHLPQAFLYRYDSRSPVMQFFYSINEKFTRSNGTFGGERMPVIFWNDTTRDLRLTTNLAADTGSAHSLLAEYNAWKLKH
jgi:hypothetical protein